MAVVEGGDEGLHGEIPVLVAVGRLRPLQRQRQAGVQPGVEARVLDVGRARMAVGDDVMEGPGVIAQGLAPVGGGGDRRLLGRGGGGGEKEGGGDGGGRLQGRAPGLVAALWNAVRTAAT